MCFFNIINSKRNHANLSSEETQESVSEALRLLLSQIELIFDYLFMLDHEFMDDFRVAMTKTKMDERRNVRRERFKIFQVLKLKLKNYDMNFFDRMTTISFSFRLSVAQLNLPTNGHTRSTFGV